MWMVIKEWKLLNSCMIINLSATVEIFFLLTRLLSFGHYTFINYVYSSSPNCFLYWVIWTTSYRISQLLEFFFLLISSNNFLSYVCAHINLKMFLSFLIFDLLFFFLSISISCSFASPLSLISSLYHQITFLSLIKCLCRINFYFPHLLTFFQGRVIVPPDKWILIYVTSLASASIERDTHTHTACVLYYMIIIIVTRQFSEGHKKWLIICYIYCRHI